MPEETTDLVKYEAKAPVRSKKTFAALLEMQKDALAELVPNHVSAKRLMKAAMVAVTKQPKLLECTQESVLQSLAESAELGLDPSGGTKGEGHLVPFNTKVDGHRRLQATFIPGFQGLAKLARQSGEIQRIEVNVVHEEDEFEFSQGTDFRLHFRQSLEENRGEALGAYSLVEYKDGTFSAEWMPKGEIEKVRNQAHSGNSPAWRNHWGEMAKKTVFRRHSKWLPKSDERMQSALEMADREYEWEVEAEGRQAAKGSVADRLVAALKESRAQEPEEGVEKSDEGVPLGGEEKAPPEAEDPPRQDVSDEDETPEPEVPEEIPQIDEEWVDELADSVPGLGEEISRRIAIAGYSSWDDLAKATTEDLTEVERVGESKAAKLIEAAGKVIHLGETLPPEEPETGDLAGVFGAD